MCLACSSCGGLRLGVLNPNPGETPLGVWSFTVKKLGTSSLYRAGQSKQLESSMCYKSFGVRKSTFFLAAGLGSIQILEQMVLSSYLMDQFARVPSFLTLLKVISVCGWSGLECRVYFFCCCCCKDHLT